MGNLIEILDMEVDWISVCAPPDATKGYPKNGFGVVLKSDDPVGGFIDCEMSISSSRALNDEDRIIYGVVYAPGVKDLDGWFVSDNIIIKKAAWNFLRSASVHNVDSFHDGNKIPQAWIAESYIVRGKDTIFPDIPEGSWVVGIKADNDALWKKFKDGELGGISLKGRVKVREVEEMTEKNELDVVERCGNAIVTFVTGIFSKQEAPAEKSAPVAEAPVAKSDVEAVAKEDSLKKISESFASLADRLTAIESRLGEIPNATTEAVSAVKAAVDEKLTAIEARVASVEKAPLPSNSATSETQKSDNASKSAFPVTQFFFGKVQN